MAYSRPTSSRLSKPSAKLGADNAGEIQFKSHAKVVASAKAAVAAATATAAKVVTSSAVHVPGSPVKYDKPLISLPPPPSGNTYHGTVIDVNDNDSDSDNNDNDYNDNDNDNDNDTDNHQLFPD